MLIISAFLLTSACNETFSMKRKRAVPVQDGKFGIVESEIRKMEIRDQQKPKKRRVMNELESLRAAATISPLERLSPSISRGHAVPVERVVITEYSKKTIKALFKANEELKYIANQDHYFSLQAARLKIFANLKNHASAVVSGNREAICEKAKLVINSLERLIKEVKFDGKSCRRFVYPVYCLVNILKSYLFYFFEVGDLGEVREINVKVNQLYRCYSKTIMGDDVWPDKKYAPVSNDMYESLLCWAAQDGNVELARFLVKVLGLDVNEKSFNAAPLFYACQHGHIDMVKFLLSEGADINAKNEYHGTPLFWAVYGTERGRSFTVIEFLIKNGAELYVCRDDYGTPFALAVSRGYLKVMDLFFRSDRFDFRLCDTLKDCELGLFDCIYGVISEFFPSVNHYSDDIPKSTFNIIKYILDRSRIDVNLSSGCIGAPILHLAVKCNLLNLVKYLVEEKGANVNIQDHTGSTPIHHAVGEKNVKMIEYLLSRGADLNIRDRRGNTPLLLAFKSPNGVNIDLVKYLVFVAGADLNLSDIKGQSPLYWSLLVQLFDVAHTLVFLGAKVCSRVIDISERYRIGRFLEGAYAIQNCSFDENCRSLILAAHSDDEEKFDVIYRVMLGELISNCFSSNEFQLEDISLYKLYRLLNGRFSPKERERLFRFVIPGTSESINYNNVLQKINRMLPLSVRGSRFSSCVKELLSKIRDFSGELVPKEFVLKIVGNLIRLEQKQVATGV